MPGRLDPRYAIDAYSSRVGSLVFASLTLIGEDGTPRPYVSDHWQWDSPTSCTFALREDFYFHDGQALTANDVVATYQSVLDPDSASPKRAALDGIIAITALGEHSVRFSLSEPNAAFFEAATIGILPARLATAGRIADADLVGAGPYRLDQVLDGSGLRLEAAPRYPGPGPYISRIEIRVVPDELMRAVELDHGSVDFAQNAVDPDTVAWLAETSDTVVVDERLSSNFQYLGINLEHPALGDVRVRRAIAYALDRNAIVTHLLRGQAKPATGLLPPEHWAYNGDVRTYDHDPARARRLLDRAGITDPDGDGPRPRLTLSYKTTTIELRRRIAVALADQLSAIGIELEILTYEWGTFFADVRSGSFHLYSLEWVGITDPDIYRQVFHSKMIPPNGNNRGHYIDRKIDRLTDHARRELDRDRRRKLYERIQRRTARTLPYIPLWWPDRVVVANRRLRDFTPAPSGDLFGLSTARLDVVEDVVGAQADPNVPSLR
jgi:peptide/nickel transport system substrate-binding protein